MARRTIAGLRAIVTGASSGIGRALVVELVGRAPKSLPSPAVPSGCDNWLKD